MTSTYIFLAELNTLKTLKIVNITETNDRLNLVYNCQAALEVDKNNSFILAARPRLTGTQYKDFNPKSLSNNYEGSNRKGVLSWLIKASLNTETLRFEC